jgi:hypothetical protein
MKKTTVYALVVANLVPVLGILFSSWDVFSVLFFYWLESAVVGFYNIPKLLLVGATLHPESRKPELGSIISRGKLVCVVFFTLHYGIFMLAHLVFILALFPHSQSLLQPILTALVALGVSHGISFNKNYLDNREYQKTNIGAQMFAPYRRIVVMHLVLIIGGWVVALTGGGTLALTAIVAVKIVIDVILHFREHLRLSNANRNNATIGNSTGYNPQ